MKTIRTALLLANCYSYCCCCCCSWWPGQFLKVPLADTGWSTAALSEGGGLVARRAAVRRTTLLVWGLGSVKSECVIVRGLLSALFCPAATCYLLILLYVRTYERPLFVVSYRTYHTIIRFGGLRTKNIRMLDWNHGALTKAWCVQWFAGAPAAHAQHSTTTTITSPPPLFRRTTAAPSLWGPTTCGRCLSKFYFR